MVLNFQVEIARQIPASVDGAKVVEPSAATWPAHPPTINQKPSQSCCHRDSSFAQRSPWSPLTTAPVSSQHAHQIELKTTAFPIYLNVKYAIYLSNWQLLQSVKHLSHIVWDAAVCRPAACLAKTTNKRLVLRIVTWLLRERAAPGSMFSCLPSIWLSTFPPSINPVLRSSMLKENAVCASRRRKISADKKLIFLLSMRIFLGFLHIFVVMTQFHRI